MNEIIPAEDQLSALFLEKKQGFALIPDDQRERFALQCLLQTLDQVDDWLNDMPETLQILFAKNAAAHNTLKSYQSDLVVFYHWCLENNKCPLPCSSIDLAHFLADQSDDGFAISTIKRRAASVSWLHRKAGFLGKLNPRESPFIKETLVNLSKDHRDKPVDKATELNTELIREMVILCKNEKNRLKGLRNRALILLGFSSALRRSNLCKIRLEDINIVIQGLEIYIPSSKTDQTGRGHVVRLARGQVPATCPVSAFKDWIDAAGIEEGYLFRPISKGGKVTGHESISAYTITLIIQELMLKLEVAHPDKYSAHSLRSGFASTAAQNGASIQSIKTQGNWRSDGSLMRYIRNREDWEVAASYKLGL